MFRKVDDIIIYYVNDHYEAYYDNKFICSGDTYIECEEDAINIVYK